LFQFSKEKETKEVDLLAHDDGPSVPPMPSSGEDERDEGASAAHQAT
jgi:hypothetical protein